MYRRLFPTSARVTDEVVSTSASGLRQGMSMRRSGPTQGKHTFYKSRDLLTTCPRLRTRSTYVQHEEAELEQKRNHCMIVFTSFRAFLLICHRHQCGQSLRECAQPPQSQWPWSLMLINLGAIYLAHHPPQSEVSQRLAGPDSSSPTPRQLVRLSSIPMCTSSRMHLMRCCIM